ncbi:MAG: PA2169 family four-helix-bundle protein [Galbibacter orientalis]|uniref:ferritin-like domain-containing protein n=1 Tax=Galbibacter orientalis TaxID=453852 RepID=UPI00300374C1
MNTKSKQIAESLNSILVKNIDAQNGFQRAIDHTENELLKAYFKSLAQGRKTFIEELKDELTYYGESYEFSGTISEDIHLGWVDFKLLFTSNTDEAMLKEAIRGEETSLQEYKNILKSEKFPERTETLLQNQLDRIQTNLVQTQEIKNSIISS